MVPGDGVGPSLVASAERVLAAVAGDVEVVHGLAGFDAYEETGEYLPAETLDLMRECGNVICGPLLPYRDESGRTVDLLDSLRGTLDLFSTVRTFRTLADGFGVPGVRATLWSSNAVKGHDVVETPDLDGITISKYIRASYYSRTMTRALSDLEFRGGDSAVCLTRDDLFPESSAMFSEAFDAAFDPARYRTEHVNISRWVSWVVQDPLRYRFIVCADLYSHVASGLLAGLTGGNHLSPLGYVGDTTLVMVPGTAESFRGVRKGAANPTSTLVGVAMCLYNSGMASEAESVFGALSATYAAGELTGEFGGELDTDAFTDRIVSRLRSGPFARALTALYRRSADTTIGSVTE